MDFVLCNTVEVKTDGNTAFLRAARSGNLEKVLEFINANIDINTANSNGLNALHLASKDGHTEVVAELLKRGAHVDAATKKGNTALHIASLAGQEEVVKLLIEHGASVNVQSQSGFTPLYMAAQENHEKVVRYLLNHGANQSLATEDGFTPLAVAMQQGHDKVVTELLENDTRGKIRLPALHIAAKKDDCKAAALLLQSEHNPDITSKSGFTPLHIASHYGNDSIASLLLAKGADVNYTAKHNITPLHVAAKWGRNNMVILLLEKGASITAKTRDGLTPLHCAARSGHEQVVDTLLQRHAPITAKTKNGLAPLHMASQGDHVEAARVLLSHRAPVDDVTVDYLTALHVASHCGHVSVAKLLLDRKADANARALNGFTPLHIACKKNRVKIVELLLKHGASIEATTESGLSPLHVASFMGCMNIVIYLLQCEANPDVATIRGETPLHLAARANQTDIIRILLRNGAQVDAKAREQQTPLHIAARVGNTDIVMLLLQHGANVDSVTKDLYTSLHIAAKEGQEEVAQTLLENGASMTAVTKKGFTPLHLAAKYGHPKLATLFLQRGAPIDAQGKNGVTPLHVASHYDHQGIALLLLDRGASPHTTAKSGHTPLHIAAKKNQMDLAAMLLEHGADAAVESKLGFTPLHLAALEGHVDMTNLLLEHKADMNCRSGNGLTPLHVCAQEDCVEVAKILINNGADVNSVTNAGYTPLHVASHFGQLNIVRFLLSQNAKVDAVTSTGYTPLHQAAQQGNSAIVALLLDSGSSPDSKNKQGQTALYIAQKLGYISVVEVLKTVTEVGKGTAANHEDKYKVVVPETIQENFMSDSEDEGGEDVTNEQSYRYLTIDEMKSLGDDSMPLDTTKEDRYDTTAGVDESISPQHTYTQLNTSISGSDNIDVTRTPIIQTGFLVSFLVDAKGGAMRGCRHSGVRVIVPPQCVTMPTRVTCRYVRKDKPNHPPPPPLMEGEALASRILELGPVNVKFLGPVVIEVPNFAALRGNEREIVILRSDNGETWREHTMDSSPEAVQEILGRSFDKDGNQIQSDEPGRITSIVTTDFPHYFAVVSRIRQEVHAIGPEGGMVSSSVVPQVQAVFPPGALTKKIKVGLQAQPIPSDLTAAILGNCVAVSPIVTIEPRRRKFHKPITLTLPVPQAANKGMINQYSGDAPTLRLLCSITGGTSRAQWEDVTGSTPLTFVKECVSFTTTVSARFWLMDIRDIAMATKKATELYREAILTPFMAKFVVFAKRIDNNEARLRVFCMTDDKEDKTLECQEHFTEVAKSRDVEVSEGKKQLLELSGNLISVTKSDQLQLGFNAFHENRLPFTVRIKDTTADPIGRMLFFKEQKPVKTSTPHAPICVLNIVLPDGVTADHEYLHSPINKYTVLNDSPSYHRSELRLLDISNLIGEDWELLAEKLGVSPSDVSVIKSEYNQSVAQQALTMLRIWYQQTGSKTSPNVLESTLVSIGRRDIVEECILSSKETVKRKDISNEIIEGYQGNKDTPSTDDDEKKYIAEEKVIDEVDCKKSVSERKKEIEKRLQDEKSRKMSKEKSESEEERQLPAFEPKVVRRQNSKPKNIVKNASETAMEEVEPTSLTFEQKRLSFERGVSIEKIVNESIIEDVDTKEEKISRSQPKVNNQDSHEETKIKSTIVEEPVEEKQLTFAENRLSFEHGKLPETKDTEKMDAIKDRSAADRRRDSELLEGVTEGLVKFENEPTVDHNFLSAELVSTPPPSPAEFKISKQNSQDDENSKPVIPGAVAKPAVENTSVDNDWKSSGSSSELIESFGSHSQSHDKDKRCRLDADELSRIPKTSDEEIFVRETIQPLSAEPQVEVINRATEFPVISSPVVCVRADEVETEFISEIPSEECRITYEVADSFTLNVQPVQVVCDLSDTASTSENEDSSKLDEFINQYVANLIEVHEPNENHETVNQKSRSNSESTSEPRSETADKLHQRKVAFRLNSTDDGLVYPGQTDSEELSSSEEEEDDDEKEEEEEEEEEEDEDEDEVLVVNKEKGDDAGIGGGCRIEVEQGKSEEKCEQGGCQLIAKKSSMVVVDPQENGKEHNVTEVERKFERMASESLDEEDGKSAEGEFHRMVSQFSVEEMDDCLKEWSQKNSLPSNFRVEGEVQQPRVTQRKSISSQLQNECSDVTLPELDKQESVDYDSKKRFWQSVESSSIENRTTPAPVPRPRASIGSISIKDESSSVLSKPKVQARHKVIKSESEDNVLLTNTSSGQNIKNATMKQMHSLIAYSTDSETEYISSCGIEKLAYENMAFSEENHDQKSGTIQTEGGVKAKKKFFEKLQKDSSSSQDDSMIVSPTSRVVPGKISALKSEEHVDKSEVEPTEKKFPSEEYEDPSTATPIDIRSGNEYSVEEGVDSTRSESDITPEDLKDKQYSLTDLESASISSHKCSDHSNISQLDLEEEVEDHKRSAIDIKMSSEEFNSKKIESSILPKVEVLSENSTECSLEVSNLEPKLENSEMVIENVKPSSISIDNNSTHNAHELIYEPIVSKDEHIESKPVEIITNQLVYNREDTSSITANQETISIEIPPIPSKTIISEVESSNQLEILPREVDEITDDKELIMSTKDDSQEPVLKEYEHIEDIKTIIGTRISKIPLLTSQSEIIRPIQKFEDEIELVSSSDTRTKTTSKIPIFKSSSDSKILEKEVSPKSTEEKIELPMHESIQHLSNERDSESSLNYKIIEEPLLENASFQSQTVTSNEKSINEVSNKIIEHDEQVSYNINEESSKSYALLDNQGVISSRKNSCSSASSSRKGSGSSKHVIFDEHIDEKVFDPLKFENTPNQPPSSLMLKKTLLLDEIKLPEYIDEDDVIIHKSGPSKHAFFEPIDLSDEMIEIPDEAEAKLIAENLVNEIEIEINKRPDIVENLILSMNIEQLDEISNDITDEDLRSTGTEMDINIPDDDQKSEHSSYMKISEVIPTECEIDYEQVEEFNVLESVDFEDLESKDASSNNLTLTNPPEQLPHTIETIIPEVDVTANEYSYQGIISPESVSSDLPRRSDSSKSSGKVVETEAHSSSSESYYQSLASGNQTGSSRPCSSDVEVLLSCPLAPSTISEYDSAVSHNTTTATSHDFHTAMSAASIQESLKSIDSESSGHLGSAEASSEISETLVPSSELEHDVDLSLTVPGIPYDECRHGIYSKVPLEPYDLDIPIEVIRAAGSSSSKLVDKSTPSQPVEAIITTIADEKLLSLEESSSSVSLTEGMNLPTVCDVASLGSEHMDSSQISDHSLTLSNISNQLVNSITNSDLKDSVDISIGTSTSPFDAHPINSVTMFTSSNQNNNKQNVNTQVTSSIEQQEISSSIDSSFEIVEKPDNLIDKVCATSEENLRKSDVNDTEKDNFKETPLTPDITSNEIDEYCSGDRTPEDQCTFEGVTFDVQEEHVLSDKGSYEDSPPNEREFYGNDVEEGKKWIEMQFQTDSDGVYEYSYERAPLEDIKEEDTDEMHSSKVGSAGSQISHHSIESAGSIKQSLSSTPDNETLPAKPRFLTKPLEPDAVSQSSLQEFEHLEQYMSLESARSKLSGSQDSLSGILGKKRGSGDDISVGSLDQFEGLEKSCIDAEINEEKAKEEERSLSQIEEGHESQASESESCETLEKSGYDDSDDDENYERKMFEIDEIIRQAQINVEKFADIDQLDKTESFGRGDSFEETSRIPDLELDQPLTDITHSSHSSEVYSGKKYIENVDLSHSLTDSLESKILNKQVEEDSLDSPARKNAKQNLNTDSLECSNADCANSMSDCSCASEKEAELLLVDTEVQIRLSPNQVGSPDSVDMTSSAATRATYQNEVDNTMSSSFTSGGSTMISSSENLEHIVNNYTNWMEGNLTYVTEVVETVTEDKSTSNSHQIIKLSSASEASKLNTENEKFEEIVESSSSSGPTEFYSKSKCTEVDGNVTVTKVLETRTVVSSEQVDSKQTFRFADKKSDELNHFSDELISHLKFSSTTPQSSRKVFKKAAEEEGEHEDHENSDKANDKKDAKVVDGKPSQ